MTCLLLSAALLWLVGGIMYNLKPTAGSARSPVDGRCSEDGDDSSVRTRCIEESLTWTPLRDGALGVSSATGRTSRRSSALVAPEQSSVPGGHVSERAASLHKTLGRSVGRFCARICTSSTQCVSSPCERPARIASQGCAYKQPDMRHPHDFKVKLIWRTET